MTDLTIKLKNAINEFIVNRENTTRMMNNSSFGINTFTVSRMLRTKAICLKTGCSNYMNLFAEAQNWIAIEDGMLKLLRLDTFDYASLSGADYDIYIPVESNNFDRAQLSEEMSITADDGKELYFRIAGVMGPPSREDILRLFLDDRFGGGSANQVPTDINNVPQANIGNIVSYDIDSLPFRDNFNYTTGNISRFIGGVPIVNIPDVMRITVKGRRDGSTHGAKRFSPEAYPFRFEPQPTLPKSVSTCLHYLISKCSNSTQFYSALSLVSKAWISGQLILDIDMSLADEFTNVMDAICTNVMKIANVAHYVKSSNSGLRTLGYIQHNFSQFFSDYVTYDEINFDPNYNDIEVMLHCLNEAYRGRLFAVSLLCQKYLLGTAYTKGSMVAYLSENVNLQISFRGCKFLAMAEAVYLAGVADGNVWRYENEGKQELHTMMY